ncbi:MAG: cyclic nucleotide-binding domain-containing protein [Candidatus Gracilibacteria bacterium]|nr:cyclic nucleotide-binding domain-containing protein [Candidatus Gracilibacteria bacterium]
MKLNLSALKKMNIGRDNPYVPILQKLSLFEGVDSFLIDSLISQCPMQSFDRGDMILSEGDESNGKAYVIISGEVDIFMGGKKISSLREGTIFGEYALICGDKRSATVRVASPLQCIIFDESDIMRISDETNKLGDILTQRITENIEAQRGIFIG